jgi:autotransporter-associated beta strand protein
MDIGGTVSDISLISGQGDFIFNGSLLNTGIGVRGLRKDGTGKVTMQAANTYNGDTVVGGGTLIVNGSLQSPLTTVNNGALLGGSGLLQGVLLNGGTISAGNSAGLLSMNSLDASNGNFIFELGAPSSRGITYDAIDVSSLLTLGTDTSFTFEVLDNYSFQMNDSYDLFNFSSIEASTFDVNTLLAALPNLDTANSNLKWDANSFTTDGVVNVIPEPSALQLFGIGLISLLACRRINKRNG